ncbi:MAG: DNA-binding LacI/PurR family transcriptional regulator [Lysobacterales bacterium]|jgi:DNA-binding LacI/PurR family transcriptional regulator
MVTCSSWGYYPLIMAEKKKVSIEDVARRAKVSITTVSRVINNVPTVVEKNRIKVEEAITHLKFKPNINAQNLARGTNNAIGLVIPGYPGIFHSFYAVELIRGVGHACEANKLDLVFHITNGFNPINTNSVGGIIFADVIENRKQVEAAIAQGTPCMIINNHVDDLEVSYLAVNNESGGYQATDYLLSLGHKEIATITGQISTQAGQERLDGYKRLMNEKGLPINEDFIFEGDYSRRSAREGAEKLLNLSKRPTAIFAASDEMALEVMAVVMEKGLKVPEDISILGFDDNPACLYAPVSLTTIRQPLFNMAEDSVRMLTKMIEDGDYELTHKLLEPELVIRESCGSPQ